MLNYQKVHGIELLGHGDIVFFLLCGSNHEGNSGADQRIHFMETDDRKAWILQPKMELSCEDSLQPMLL